MPPTCKNIHLGFTDPHNEYFVDPATKTLIHGQHGHDRVRFFRDASDEIEIFALLLSCVRYAMDPAGQEMVAPVGRIAFREAVQRMRKMFPGFDLGESLRQSALHDQARDRVRSRAAEGLEVGE